MVEVRQWRKRRRGGTAKLGEVVKRLMNHRISLRQARLGSVVELWGRLLPAELGRHCEVADVSGGQLKVLVDSPTYASELRLCCSQLLIELQRQCPRARIKEIKIALNGTADC